ncbi:MAG: hypothetical protein RIB45_12595 [Marivibrio sp.]|uniref:hypothetical protein n=1 Tax=Marivibrio sp. TaxID=2039719 RepID=UPI0032EBAB48
MAAHLPNSFQERGVAVPFETDAVRNARLRGESAKRREALLPGLSGGEGTYVVPFKALPELVELTLYDRALFDAVEAEDDELAPMDMREIVLQVDAQGYGGVDRTKAAKQELAYADTVAIFNQCLLIVRALKLLADDSLDMDLKVLITPEGQRLAKEHFRGYAQHAGTSSDEIMRKLEQWARLIGTVGVRQAEHVGYLRRDQIRLKEMTDDLRAYIAKEPPEAQAMGRGIVEAADLASEIVDEEVEACWAYEASIAKTLENAGPAMADLRKRIETISWVLDGWRRMMDAWDDSAEAFRSQRRKVLEMIYENLPVLPKSILQRNQLEKASVIREQQKGWVKANTDWRTEELDEEMVGRLQSFKTIEE